MTAAEGREHAGRLRDPYRVQGAWPGAASGTPSQALQPALVPQVHAGPPLRLLAVPVRRVARRPQHVTTERTAQ